MNDKIAKVIKGLRCCISNEVDSCIPCPYYDSGKSWTFHHCSDKMHEEIIDLIERLSAEPKAAKSNVQNIRVNQSAQQGWISVADRLPKPGIAKLIVAVRHEHGGIVDMARYLGRQGWGLTSWGLWDKNVTHWMPMPEPPTELVYHEYTVSIP